MKQVLLTDLELEILLDITAVHEEVESAFYVLQIRTKLSKALAARPVKEEHDE